MQVLLGPASLERIANWHFPTHQLVSGDGTVVATLGRDGWFRIFFGRGRGVALPDGSAWRIHASGAGRFIVPMVTCATGKLAVGAPLGKRSYGIDGPDYTYRLYPTRRSGLRVGGWTLREHETELATLQSTALIAKRPIPLSAALLSFTLIKFGVVGEANLWVPQFSWG